MTQDIKQRSRGIDQLIRLCEALHHHQRPMSVRELIEATGLPRSSVYNITNTFTQAGWLESEHGGRLFFGRAFHYYGLDYADHNSLIKRARPVMRQLASAFNETTQLCALDGDKYTVLLNEHGARPFSISSEIGRKVAIPWTASGRVLLRDMDRSAIREFIPEHDFVLPDGKQLDITTFLDDIDKARMQGYALTKGLVDSFTVCIAAPITATSGQVCATVCFTIGRDTPTARVDELIQALKKAGYSLSH